MKKINRKPLPLISISRETTLLNQTGNWRTQKPVLERKFSSCTKACPLGNNIPHWISLIKQGEYKKAWEALIEQNPLPAVTGRVCQAFCEKNCNRSQFDEGISIRALERFLGGKALEHGWKTQPAKNQKPSRIAVVGSGPAGLSCVYQLARRGFQVTIFEAMPVLGGMLRLGIPRYRLPTEILNQEILYNILSLGVEIKTDVRIGESLSLEELIKKFDAIFVATGAHQSRKLNIPGEESQRIISGLDFLQKLNLGEKVGIGRNIVVIGGGNTAIDAARSSYRLGAKVTILYRRSEEEMPAIKEEIGIAKKEGIDIQILTAPLKVLAQDNQVIGLECIKMALCAKDDSGRRKPIPIEDSNFVIEADTIITAIGEEPDLGFLAGFNNDPKVFKGGDAFTKAGTVADAIGSGKKAAEDLEKAVLGKSSEIIETAKIVQFEDLNLDYFKKQAKIKNISSQGLAKREAKRCFSCGWCNLCRNCQIFCPDSAAFEIDGKVQINYDYCKGCGICAEECPTKSITLHLESGEE